MNIIITLFAGIIMISAFIFLAFLLKSKSPYKGGKINRFYLVPILLITMTITMVFQGCHENNIIVPTKKKYVWAVGEPDSTNHGTILFSNDGGATWTQQGTNCAALLGIKLSDVWAVDENTVWVVGHKDLILKTTDGGLDWTQITPAALDTNINLNSISIVGKNNVWISTSDGQVFHSIDGGTHWTDLKSSVLSKHYLQGIHAINNNIVYVAGNNNKDLGFIARTTDGGQTWDSIAPSPGLKAHPPIGIAATDINHIVVYGGTSQYMMTTNGGQSWVNDTIPKAIGGGGGADINCMKMLDAQTWWGALDLGNISITKDAGNTWLSQGPVSGSLFLVGIDYYDKDLCVIVGIKTGEPPIYGEIIRTTDGGQTWDLVKKTYAGLWKVSFIK